MSFQKWYEDILPAQGGGSSPTPTPPADEYDIDLNDGNAEKLRLLFEPYINAGRRVGGRRSTGSGTGKRSAGRSASGLDLNEVRTWARQNGHVVSDRGRVSAVVLDAYKAAH